MGTLTIAYSAAWLAVGAYVAWLAIQNANLAKRQEEIRSAGADHSEQAPFSKAA
jgi:threonine/homoserine/homoserine lactone efflux protein